MPIPRIVVAWLVLTLLGALVPPPTEAKATPKTCRAAIRKGTGNLIASTLRAVGGCKRDVVAGLRPADTDCVAATALSLDHAVGALHSDLGRCCGKNKICSDADDFPLADIGWDLGTCPDLGGGRCVAPLATIRDIERCLACITDQNLGTAMSLVFDDVHPPDPRAPGVSTCRRTLGNAVLNALRLRGDPLRACWRRHTTSPSRLCPTFSTNRALTKRQKKTIASVCRGCGGEDGCGGNNDLSPATIGFPATCPDVTTVGGASCARPVTTVADVAECVACVTAHHADCIDRATVPQFLTFPTECRTAP